MNNKDKALRAAAEAFLILHFGGKMTREQYKTFADLCALAMPMKYRFEKSEFDSFKQRATVTDPDPARIKVDIDLYKCACSPHCKLQALAFSDKESGLRLTGAKHSGHWLTTKTFQCEFDLNDLALFAKK